MSSGGEGCKRRNGVGYLELSARLGGHLRGNELNVLHKLFFHLHECILLLRVRRVLLMIGSNQDRKLYKKVHDVIDISPLGHFQD